MSQLAGRWSVGVVLTTPAWLVAASTARSEARYYRLGIAISTYPTFIRRPLYGGSRRNSVMPFGNEKLEWLAAWLPDGEKNSKMSIRFDRT